MSDFFRWLHEHTRFFWEMLHTRNIFELFSLEKTNFRGFSKIYKSSQRSKHIMPRLFESKCLPQKSCRLNYCAPRQAKNYCAARQRVNVSEVTNIIFLIPVCNFMLYIFQDFWNYNTEKIKNTFVQIHRFRGVGVLKSCILGETKNNTGSYASAGTAHRLGEPRPWSNHVSPG